MFSHIEKRKHSYRERIMDNMILIHEELIEGLQYCFSNTTSNYSTVWSYFTNTIQTIHIFRRLQE